MGEYERDLSLLFREGQNEIYQFFEVGVGDARRVRGHGGAAGDRGPVAFAAFVYFLDEHVFRRTLFHRAIGQRGADFLLALVLLGYIFPRRAYALFIDRMAGQATALLRQIQALFCPGCGALVGGGYLVYALG